MSQATDTKLIVDIAEAAGISIPLSSPEGGPYDVAKHVVSELRSINEELKWLRFFYEKARNSMGPADGDIYRYIAEKFKGTLPESYRLYLFGEPEE